MKLIKIAMTIILGMTLLTGIACNCGGKSADLPDLVVEEFVGGGGWCVSSMTVTVKNIGTADAGPFTVTVKGTYPPYKNYGTYGNVSGLPAGQETSLQFEYHYFASGPFAGSATATADAAAQVTESNESNNEIISVQSMPEPCPSLTPTPTPTH
jgi:hypothetical protein